MQNIGFVYGLIPGLKDIYGGNRDKVEKAIERYIDFFNTQPYMTPLIMGICLSQEKQGRPSVVGQAKMSMAGALAAIGDSFFWGALKPIVSLLALMFVMINLIWGIILSLVLFNIVHIWIKVKGVKEGYGNGPGAVLRMGKVLSIERIERIKYILPFMVGVVLFILPSYIGSGVSPAIGGWLFGGFIVFMFMNYLGISTSSSFYIGFIVLLIWSIIR